MREIVFGTEEFPSADPDAANAAYGKLFGKNVAQAQKLVVEMLRDPASSATGSGPPLQSDPKPIQHAVRFYEKGDRPLEFVTSRQWFVRLLDRKEALLQQGETIEWHPEFMRSRYRNWTENLGIDWCVSRQRYFGVPIPCWYPVRADGTLDHERPLYPAAEALPVDPMSDCPPGFSEDQRNAPGGFSGDPDVFDTWFTSSLTPQISSHWRPKDPPARHAKLFPADLRPQSHEIIRTWAFYTIAKALLHSSSVPWHHVAISGWILDPDRKKMSKSAGNVVTPVKLLDDYGADGVRYWASGARLGMDTAFDEKVLKIGKRLVTKIFNAAKFVLSQAGGDGAPTGHAAISEEIDRAFVHGLRGVVESATSRFAEFEFAHALMETEQFFWSRLTDTYLELVKVRARGESGTPAGRASAVATLRLGLDVLLRLFAPVLPYVTEETWSWAFAEETGHPSIHRAPWPSTSELASVPLPKDAGSLDLAIELYSAINKKKTDLGASTGRIVTQTALTAHEARVARIAPVLEDVLAAAKVKGHTLAVDPGLAEEAGFVVGETVIAPKEDKTAPAES
jgi:valyl-tRNA synthetase